MKPQIIIYDHNHVEVGTTYPRRAKGLIGKSKAQWLDGLQNAIIMSPPSSGGIEMDKDLKSLTDRLFEEADQTNDITDIKDEFMETIHKKFEALVAEGMNKGDAIKKLEMETGDIKRLVKGFSREKSFVKDAYREDVDVIMRSSPFEIIKKSRTRTRELHMAFSAVLWSGTLLVYLAVNFFIGNTQFTIDPGHLSATWLIFVVAAIIECSVEIYFSGKALDVLNENIDLRQINPNWDGDMDLWGYKKKLMRKIRIMSSAVTWIPLVLLFFIGVYLHWPLIWIVFLFGFGIFLELLMNFIRKLKKAKAKPAHYSP